MGKRNCTRKKQRKQPYKSKKTEEKDKKRDENQNTEEKEARQICQLCKDNKDSDVDVCDWCQKYFCLKCVNGKHWRYECDENDLSYHHFCTCKCLNKWYETYTFPCDGGCIQLLSRRKQTSRYWGNYLNPFF